MFVIFSLVLFLINLRNGKFIEIIYFGFPFDFITIRKYIQPIYKGISINLLILFVNILIFYIIYRFLNWIFKKLI